MSDKPAEQSNSPQALTLSDLAPVAYGARLEVLALAKRIMAVHPSAKQIGDRGALLLAQLGFALRLNPLPGTGHIHAWIDDDGRMCVHIGLEGRAALARRDSTYSYTTRPMRAEEAEEHSLKPGDRGYICELFRHDLTREMVAMKIPVNPFSGIGIARANERVPKGRSLAWRATQRALKDALRAAFSFSLPDELAGAVRIEEDEASIPDDVIDGTATEVQPADGAEGESGAQPSSTGDTPEAPTQLPARPYAPSVLKSKLAERAEANAHGEVNGQRRGLFAGQLEQVFAPDPDSKEKRHAVTAYLFGVESVKDLTAAQVLAGLEWLKPSRDGAGDYHSDSMAAREALLVYESAIGKTNEQPEPATAGDSE